MANVDEKTRGLVMLAVIGLIAGYLAAIVVGGGGLIRYLVSGVIGAFVGGWLLQTFGVNLGIKNQFASQVATATLGAIVVVLVARLIT